MKDDRFFLQHAVRIAELGIENGKGPFGAVITKDNDIIAEANNDVVLSHDPTAHAEIIAIRKASALLMTHDLSECVLYTSCEPCPMCLGAVYWSGIKKVVYGSDRTDAEKSGFSDRMIYDELMLEPGDRKILFIRISDAGDSKVFQKWDEYEDKVRY